MNQHRNHEHLVDHRHTASLDDTFDFLNTSELDGFGRPVEHLGHFTDATVWLEEHGLLHPSKRKPLDNADPARAAKLLRHVRTVRSGLREIVEALVAERPVAPQALVTVNDVLRARSVLELVPGEGCVTLGHRHLGDPLDDALAAVAEPLVALIASGDTGRLRICAHDGCSWVFQDASRTGRRRWCSMETCGNRAKAARHRERKRAAPTPATEATAPSAEAAQASA